MVDLYARMPITVKADVFALGVALYRFMYKVLPFPEGEVLANFNVRFTFPDETEEYLRRGKYEEKDDVPIYSPELKELVRHCLTRDPEKRPSIFQIAKEVEKLLGHPFGAEEENIKEVQIEDNTNSMINSNINGDASNGGVSSLFDWAPVQGTVGKQVPMSTPMAATQQSQAPSQTVSLFDTQPTQDVKQVQQDKGPQVSSAPSGLRGNLFGWDTQPEQTESTTQITVSEPKSADLLFDNTPQQPQ